MDLVVKFVVSSLAFFMAVALLLRKGVSFYPSLGLSTVALLVSLGSMVFVLGKFGYKF